jgi:hypothetical protein
VVFRGEEVRRLGRSLLAARRRRVRSDDKGKIGRPLLRGAVQVVIRDLVDERRWSPIHSIKALTREVNLRGKLPTIVSEDTVARALDELYAITTDRRFDRVHRKPKPQEP